MLIAVLNVKFHLFHELTNQYTVVIVSDKINHKIPEMIEVHDTPEMIEVHDTPEMIEVHDTPEMIEENQQL